MKQLFFDDGHLFGRDNVVRKYGSPKLESVYDDGIFSTDTSTGYVFRTSDGRYRMVYSGKNIKDHGIACLMAVSEDGVHFEPESLSEKIKLKNRVAENELFKLPEEEPEVACVFDDKHAGLEERYKALVCERYLDGMTQKNLLYVSPDLLHWKLKRNVNWGVGAEPVADVFYNKDRESNTILLRPDWGVRRVGYVETRDWKSYTKYSPCIQADSLDEPLAEIYGMKAMEYHGMYIGFPYLYSGHQNEYNGKYYGGILGSQLAYSYDGRYWLRSLRTPFLGMGAALEEGCCENPLIWLSCAREYEDGDIILYASASEYVHGEAFGKPGTGRIHIYRLRKDGFICLETEDKRRESVVCTREKVWCKGELHVNIRAENATVAVRESSERSPQDTNFMGFSEELEGYGHEDCVPFSGDSKDWVPEFRNGKKLDDLKGKTVIFEIRFTNGFLYSLEGDFINIGNIQASRYRKMNKLPDIKW